MLTLATYITLTSVWVLKLQVDRRLLSFYLVHEGDRHSYAFGRSEMVAGGDIMMLLDC
jgi:hypothetical protein